MKIYIDMDQTLVNFLAGVRKALGLEFNDPRLGTEKEKFVYLSTIKNFWVDLDWMPGAEQLWDRVKKYDTYVISAAPPKEDNPDCAVEKKVWCIIHLGINKERAIICNRSEKKNYAQTVTPSGKFTPNLLIDDHPLTVQEWIDAGGIAIKHSTVTETLKELTQLGL